MISILFSMFYCFGALLLLCWCRIFSQIPANHHLTVTHPSYSRGFDYAFIASFLDIFVREGGTLNASIQRSLHLGRLDKTNVVIKTGNNCVTLVSRKKNNLWLGAKTCCPQSCLKAKQNMLTCENCHLMTSLPRCLTPQVIGDFVDTYQRQKEKAIGAWYNLTAGAYCELPVWSNNVVVMDSPPTVRQRKRRYSDVDWTIYSLVNCLYFCILTALLQLPFSRIISLTLAYLYFGTVLSCTFKLKYVW